MSATQRKKWIVPDGIMIPILQEMQRELGRCADNFITYDLEQLRQKCGPGYAGVPLDDIRRQSINLRKRGVVGKIKGHGPSKRQPREIPDWLAEYYETPHWQAFRLNVLRFWNWRCAICNHPDSRDVHHRTYERKGGEQLTDCILLCRQCHDLYHDNKDESATLFSREA